MKNFIDHELFLEKLGNKKIFPLLILDEIWLKRFPKDQKNKKIKKLEVDLKNKIKEEARYTGELKALNSLKSKYLQNILELTGNLDSNSIDDSITYSMKEYKVRIDEINRQILDIEDILAELPDHIHQLNFELMEETVVTCYNIMRQSEYELEKVIPEIDKLRLELEQLVNKRLKLEIDKDNTFNLLHAIVGKEVIDFIDDHVERNNKN